MDFTDTPGLTRSEREDYERRLAEEALKLEQAASKEEEEQEPEPEPTPESVAKDKSIQKAELERGPITDIGEGLKYLATGGIADDALNALVAGANQLTGGRLQGLDDAVGSYDEQQEREAAMFTELQEQQQAGELSPVESAALGTAQVATGIGEGAVAGAMLPATLVARIANQQASWADTPVFLKDNKAADAAFKITEILLPSLLIPGGGAVGAGGKYLGLKALESAAETTTQRGADDLLFGRQGAQAMGDIANSLGFDGAQLTRDLIEGRKPNAQVITAIGGFFQNMGINIAGDFAVERIAKMLKPKTRALAKADKRIPRDRRLPRTPQPRLTDPDLAVEKVTVEVIDDTTKQVAKLLKQSPEEVKKAVDDTFEAPYTPTKEPHDVHNTTTTVPTQKPSKASGNKFVGEESLIRRIVGESKYRKDGVDSSGFTKADRDYFTNWEAVAGSKETRQVLQEITQAWKRLRPADKEFREGLRRSIDFWDANKALLGEDVTEFAKKVFDNKDMARRVKERPEIDFSGDWEKIMTENTEVFGIEGFTVLRLAAEDLGLRVSKQANMLKNLNENNVDYTAAMELFIDFHEKADLLLVPLRRAKRRWALEGQGQQNWWQKYIRQRDSAKEYREILDRTPSASAAYGDYTKIGFDPVDDTAANLRTLWNSYKQGDKEAGKVLDAYMEAMAKLRPDRTTSAMGYMNQIIDQYSKNRLPEALKSIEYATMLASVEPHKAAAVGAFFDIFTDGAGAFFSGTRRAIISGGKDIQARADAMYGIGMMRGFGTALTAGFQNAIEAGRTGRMMHSNERLSDSMLNQWAVRSRELDFIHQRNLQRIKSENLGTLAEVAEWLSHKYAQIGNARFTNSFMRGLSAIDQGVTTNLGIQHAYGKAYREAFLNGHIYDEAGKKVMFGEKTALERYVDGALLNTFEGGIKGRLIDDDIMNAVRRTTLSMEIDPDMVYTPTAKNPLLGAIQTVTSIADQKIADGAYKIEKAAQTNFLFRMVSPFTRVSYTFLDTAAQTIPFFEAIIPRYKAISAGEEGVAAMVKFKANRAKAQVLGLSFGMLAANGYYLGQNTPAGMENAKQSIIIPNPESDTGYTAIPIGRSLGPLIVFMDLIADTVNAFRDHAITKNEYNTLISEIMASMQAGTLEQSFVNGIERLGAILNSENPTGLINYVATQAGNYSGAGLGKQGFRLFQPYETYGSDPNNLWESWQMTVRQRLVGGVGNPIKYNIYTGKPKTKAGSERGGYWQHVGESMLNTFGWEQGLRDAPSRKDPKDPSKPSNIYFELDRIGYDDTKHYRQTSIQIPGVPTFKLTAQQRSELDRLTGDPEGGDLSGKLNELFVSPKYTKAVKELEKVIKSEPRVKAGFDPEAQSKRIMSVLHAEVNSVFTVARAEAFNKLMESGTFPELTQQIDTEELRRLGQYY